MVAASRDWRVLQAAVLGMGALSALPCAVAPNTVRAVIENGVCYGLCGHHAVVDETGNSQQPADPDASYGGHAAGGDHVGPCGGEWLTNPDLPITQSCCRVGNNPPTISTGEYACVCPMEVTCAGMGAGEATGCPEDLDADGVVNVNDLLSLLSGFGGTDPAPDVNDDGIVDVNDLLQLLSAFGSTDCAAGSGGAGGAAAPCAYGEDCGGQQFTECGTMCPATCGQMPGMMCNMMCYNGFQCPNGQFWDENANGVGSGSCVQQDDCSIPMPELPPGIAPGRPFLTAKTLPTFSQAVEQAVSDWVGMVGPDGKHNHDGRPGGDYGQEEEF